MRNSLSMTLGAGSVRLGTLEGPIVTHELAVSEESPGVAQSPILPQRTGAGHSPEDETKLAAAKAHEQAAQAADDGRLPQPSWGSSQLSTDENTASESMHESGKRQDGPRSRRAKQRAKEEQVTQELKCLRAENMILRTRNAFLEQQLAKNNPGGDVWKDCDTTAFDIASNAGDENKDLVDRLSSLERNYSELNNLIMNVPKLGYRTSTCQ